MKLNNIEFNNNENYNLIDLETILVNSSEYKAIIDNAFADKEIELNESLSTNEEITKHM